MSQEPVADFLANIASYVDHRMSPYVPFRATVTAIAAGLIQIQPQDSIDADTEEYAHCNGFAPAVGDEVLCQNINGHPIIINTILRTALDTVVDADWYSDLQDAINASDGRPIYVKTARTQANPISIPSALQNKFSLIGTGRQSRITYSGAGAFFTADLTAPPATASRRSNWLIAGLNIAGPGSGVAGSIGFLINNALSGTMKDMSISSFEIDLKLDGLAGANGAAVWYNEFLNVLCSNAITAISIGEAANSNTFHGGRACNSTTGINITATAANTSNNSFFGMDIESNSGTNAIAIAGNQTQFFGCRHENPSATNEAFFDDSLGGSNGKHNVIWGNFSTNSVNSAISWDKARDNTVIGRRYFFMPNISKNDEPIRQIVKDPGAATATALGLAAPTLTATAASADDTDGMFLGHTTTAVANNPSGMITAFTQTRRDHSPFLSLRMKTGASITSSRIWAGLFNQSPDLSTGTTGDHFAAFRRDTVAGDSNWVAVTNDGGATPTTTDTGKSVAVDTAYDMRIECIGTTAVAFYINDDLVATHTTDLPGSATLLGIGVRITTLTTATKVIKWSYARLKHL